MSIVFRRTLTTKAPIPPILNVAQAGSTQRDRLFLAHLVNMYGKLPKGPAPQKPPQGLLDRYRRRYIDTGSPVPLVHAILIIGLVGYTLDYNNHLKYHKNQKHH